MPLGAMGMADAAGHSKGQKLKLGWQQRVPLGEWTLDLGARADCRVRPQHRLFADLGVVAYGDRFAASPLVDRRTVPSVRVSWLARF